MTLFPSELFRIGPLSVTDTMLVSLVVSVLLVAVGRLALRSPRARSALEIVYAALESSITSMTVSNVRPLVPLVLTQWLFIGVANLAGLLPGIASPTRDLSIAAALAMVSFVAGHVHAARTRGIAYLRQYIEPSPFLLPFNVIGELSRTVALALRLFGNMLSGTLIGAILVYIAGLLVPVPLMLLGALTAVVQAYIFGVLTLVFAASSVENAMRPERERKHGGAQ
ncbi:MAG: F0F1 ATP synthase subunit A [Polyangiaceae bacterium]|nr:F0F1 ATP synthase subunit A [Polyangiaceae bacterium]